MKMKVVSTLIALCIGSLLQAQTATVEAEFNNFRWTTSINGSMFFDVDNSMPGFEVPVNSDNHAIFASNFWIGGRNAQDSVLHLTAERYCQNPGCQLGPGPLKLDGTPGDWSLATSPYNRFWLVSKVQVDAHLAYHNCANDPDCDVQAFFPEGYTPPDDFLSWPAMGISDEGFATYLAPFFDYNGDGLYDANTGDYPLFCGDMALYSISNDLSNRPESTFWSPGLGVEVHTQYYGFFSEEPELFNTLFIHKRMINRSSATYTNVYLGTWNEFGLGNPFNDCVGTDVQRSMVYVYNGTDFDGPSSSGPGYGDDLPMLGIRILGGPFQDPNGADDTALSSDFETYGNQGPGWGDGIVDNERLALATSLQYRIMGQNPGIWPFEAPLFPEEYYGYMRAIWTNGTPMSVGDLGYSVSGNATSSKYMYFGLSDPLLVGTSGIDPNYPDPDGWTEETAGNVPGDRRMLASSGPFTFAPGDEQVLDYAYIFARDSQEPGTDVLETLQSYADAIAGMECGELPQVITLVRDHQNPRFGFSLFPNPARHTVTLEIQHVHNGIYTLHDLTGRAVAQGRTSGVRTEIPLGHLPKGMYLVRCEAGGEVASGKLIVE